MNATYGLEYVMFFGVPSNKTELIDGISHWRFPFRSRDEAEIHFHEWLATLRRWKQVDSQTPITKSEKNWEVEIGGIHMQLYPRPINIDFPIEWRVFRAFISTYNRRDYWPGQPAGLETGWDHWLDLGDIGLNLWRVFGEVSARHGGKYCSRADIALTPSAGMAPDAYYYGPDRSDIMIEGDYFCAAPDLVAEVLSAPSRWLDRGPRSDVYRRAGVRHLWLLEPATETIEIYELQADYELIARRGIGDRFESPLFPGDAISVESLFSTQSKRKGWHTAEDDSKEPEPIPEWIVSPKTNVGLEYFFHLGHPERRWEFWDNKARSMLAFGSAVEARARLDHFITEACRWESLSRPKISQLAEDIEQTEIGRFQLTRRGQIVLLDVAIDGRRHRDILTRWADSDCWDWGED